MKRVGACVSLAAASLAHARASVARPPTLMFPPLARAPVFVLLLVDGGVDLGGDDGLLAAGGEDGALEGESHV